MEVNAQCQQILAGIERLEEYLQEQIAKEALDLDSNFDTTTNKELLLRLKKSLLQYTERGKNLVYIGLMGHFSTGKSSTINSLLNLDQNSEEARKVGLNPVDKAITLITHSENRDSVFNTTKEGLVSIRSSFVDSDFLRNIVIADTPGTGDPILASEIAKDFLPICDLIIYFFSSAIPLDSADVPLLSEKFSQLAFIPLHFVVTRADEFKKSHETSFNAENFDKVKADIFLNELGQRINHLFNGESGIDTQSITLIDNKSKFNIEQLRQFLLNFANVSDVQSHINIHSHKIIYFKSSAEKLKSFFCSFLLEKLRVLSNTIKTSQGNIDRFKGKIRLTNNALTESWNIKIASISTKKYDAYAALPTLVELPSSLELIYSRSESLSLLKYHVKQEASKQVISIKNGIARNVLSQLKSDTASNKRRISNVTALDFLNNFEAFELKLSTPQKDKLFASIDFVPSPMLLDQSLKISSEANHKISQYYRDLESAVETLKKLLYEQLPIKEYQLLLNSAINDLTDDFDAYFEIIRVYRSGVFSLNVKEAIAKLGLGHRMDELESDELTDEQKMAVKQDAKEHIFPGASSIFTDTLKSLAELLVRAEDLQKKIKTLSSHSSIQSNNLEEWKNSRIAVIEDEMFVNVESDVNRLKQVINGKIRDLFTKFSGEWESEVDRMKSERKKRFVTLAFSFGLAGVVLYLLYIFGANRDLANNIFIAFLFGVAVNLASNIVGFIWAKITDRFPISIRLKESEVLGCLREEYLQIVDRGMSSFESSVSADDQLFHEFWKELLITILRTKFEQVLSLKP